MMKFRLSHHHVIALRYNRVCFQYHGMTLGLSEHQFLNLDDYIRSYLRGHRHPNAIPLGRTLWLHLRPYPRLSNRYVSIPFSYRIWYKYISRMHDRVVSFMQHASYRAGDQRHARDGRRRARQSTRRSQTVPPEQTLSSPPSYAGDQDAIRPQSTIVSMRQTSDTRQPFQFSRALNELGRFERHTRTGSPLSHVSSDDEEYGSYWSVEAAGGSSSD